MSGHEWHMILARITPDMPVDLDALVADAAGEKAPAAWPRPSEEGSPPSAKLWARKDGPDACIGVRVTRPLDDPTSAACRLAAAAIERGVRPVILSYLPEAGFERFGFRVERITDPAQEEEIARFWDLALIIDASEVGLLG